MKRTWMYLWLINVKRCHTIATYFRMYWGIWQSAVPLIVKSTTMKQLTRYHVDTILRNIRFFFWIKLDGTLTNFWIRVLIRIRFSILSMVDTFHRKHGGGGTRVEVPVRLCVGAPLSPVCGFLFCKHFLFEATAWLRSMTWISYKIWKARRSLELRLKTWVHFKNYAAETLPFRSTSTLNEDTKSGNKMHATHRPSQRRHTVDHLR